MKKHKKNKQVDEMDPDQQTPDASVDPESVVDHDDEKIELEQQLGEWQAKYQRALADFQNFQRRSIANEANARREGVESVIKALMAFSDNFDRALDMDTESTSAASILQGVSVLRDELRQVLGGFGVGRIEPAAGEEFDPERHEAMIQVPAPDVTPGCVVDTYERGYIIENRVLRPAKVAIAREAEPTPEPSEADAE